MLKTKMSVYQGHSTHQIIIVIPFLPPVVDCLPLEKGFQKGGWVGGGGGSGAAQDLPSYSFDHASSVLAVT